MTGLMESALKISRSTNGKWLGIASSLLLLIVISTLFQIRYSPANRKLHVDGTVFAYGGARILEGELPYRDFWDHKPPGIFYLNAAAFQLGGVDEWSIWYLTAVWAVLITGSFFWLLTRLISWPYAFIATAIFMATLMQEKFYEASNLTEYYGVLFTILALLFTHMYFSRPRIGYLVGLGVAFAAGALLKHTNVATVLVSISIVSFVELRRRGTWQAVRAIIAFAVPGIIAASLVALYWGANGAFADLWEATINYNLIRIAGGFGPRTLYGTLRFIAADSSLGPLFVLATSAALALWFFRRKWAPALARGSIDARWEPLPVQWTYAVCVGALLMEIVFIALAARGFAHYYLSLIPTLCISTSYWFLSSSRRGDREGLLLSLPSNSQILVSASLVVWLIVTFGLARPSFDDIRSYVLDAPVRRTPRTEISRYISEQTDPDDTVLAWNNGAEINFDSYRRAPNRYIYYYPLFQPGFQNERRWAEFVSDLEQSPPALIISRWQRGSAPRFDEPLEDLGAICGCDGEILAGLRSFSEFVKSNYERELILDDSIAAYHLTTD